MITCNRCGSTNPAGVLNCQVCGTPLATRIENELSPRTAGQGQPPLPAWLETLRAGDRPAAPANMPAGNSFSAADLLDEGTLPSWMRSGRAEPDENVPSASPNAFSPDPFSQSAPQAALRPSAQSGPNTGDDGLPPRGLAANSLIDEKALPSWMQESKPAQLEPQSGISAASLLQPDALPEWMRAMQTQQTSPAAQGSFPYSQQPSAPLAAMPPSRPEAPFSAPAQQGFSAGDLIDPKSLPSWMSSQDKPQNAPAIPGTVPSGQPGFSAASLLDADALPGWLQGGQSQQNTGASGPVVSNPSRPLAAAQNSWPPAPSPIQIPPAQSLTAGIAASSFIDVNALPDWMRSEGGAGAQQPPQPGMAASRPGYAGPPRVENVRVPSRPRNEPAAGDTSEVAANVFASMLGVASSPQYTVQPGSSPLPQQGGQYTSPQMPQGVSSPMASTGMSSGIYGQKPATPTGAAQPPSPTYGIPGGYQSGAPQGNIPGAYSPGMLQGAGPFPNTPGVNAQYGSMPYPGNMSGAGSPLPGQAGAANAQKSAKPAKRGFFDALRNLFFH